MKMEGMEGEIRGLSKWHNNGTAVVSESGRFIGNAADEVQARLIAWNHNDEIKTELENRRLGSVTGANALSK